MRCVERTDHIKKRKVTWFVTKIHPSCSPSFIIKHQQRRINAIHIDDLRVPRSNYKSAACLICNVQARRRYIDPHATLETSASFPHQTRPTELLSSSAVASQTHDNH